MRSPITKFVEIQPLSESAREQARTVQAEVQAKYGPHYAELEKALARIGDTPAKAMQRILSWVRCDLSALSQGDWFNLRYEIAIFVQTGPLGLKVPIRQGTTQKDWSWRLRKKGVDVPDETPEKEIQQRRLPSAEAVQELLDGVGRHLEELIQTGETGFPQPKATLRVLHLKEQDRVASLLLPDLTEEDTRENAFWFYFANLLTLYAYRIRRCPESGHPKCQSIFLADRRNQEYCGVRCRSRVASRQYRGTPPDRIGKQGRPSKKEMEERKRKRRKLLAGRRYRGASRRKARKRG